MRVKFTLALMAQQPLAVNYVATFWVCDVMLLYLPEIMRKVACLLDMRKVMFAAQIIRDYQQIIPELARRLVQEARER